MPYSQAAYVYVIERGNRVKVGSSISPEERTRVVGGKSARLAFVSDGLENGRRVERIAHDILKLNASCVENEWFATSVDEAKSAILQAIDIHSGAADPPDGVFRHKGGKYMQVIIPADLKSRLDRFVGADEENRTRRSIFEAALREYLDRNEKE